MRTLTLTFALLAAPALAHAQAKPPEKVDFIGSAQSPISASVAIPEGAAWVWTSGTVPSPADRNAPAGSAARYGDTKTQALSALAAIEERLKARGLSMKDVVFLRCYLVGDKHNGGTVDYAGWNAAYGQYFNNANNPTKPTRTTLAIAGLGNPDLLVEIEAIAVYPKM
jgi:enamine deaminase RidA (YjgF/YER057c/UK114 family)